MNVQLYLKHNEWEAQSGNFDPLFIPTGVSCQALEE